MSDNRSDPNALRFLIGHDLRAARERANVKQSAAAAVLDCSQSKINALESARQQQVPADVATLLRFYGAPVEHIDRMTSLAGRADQGVWWAPFDDVLPGWFKTFVGLEGLATEAFTYEPLLIPGQLQTPAYAAGLLDGNLTVPPLEVPQVVAARMARQRVADEANPLQFCAVIEEYALQRVVGGPDVMTAQLEHLLALTERDNVALHVMPLSVVTHDGLDGDFMLLNFDQAQSIGYIEYPAGALYLQEYDQVARYSMVAGRLRAAALSETDSAAYIRSRLTALARSD